MNTKTVRLGVVGTGIWGKMHIRAYQQHASAELVGVCDLDKPGKAALNVLEMLGYSVLGVQNYIVNVGVAIY